MDERDISFPIGGSRGCPSSGGIDPETNVDVMRMPLVEGIHVEGDFAAEEFSNLINQEVLTMRIAISAEENKGLESNVSHHFGRCPFFVIVDVEDTMVEKVEVIENPFFAGHQPGMVPGFINEQGVQVMLSGGMGRRAIGFFQQYGISPATGAHGTVQLTLDSYLRGELQQAAPCKESIEHAHDDTH